MLEFRPATSADSELIYAWNTDPVTRANSFSTAEFSFEHHDKWFSSKLNNPESLFLIFSNRERLPVGLVRIEKSESNWFIGITVDKNARGKGFAAQMITAATAFHFKKHKQPIFAQIKNENAASLRVFEKAGYRFDKKLEINNIPSSQYIYENS